MIHKTETVWHCFSDRIVRAHLLKGHVTAWMNSEGNQLQWKIQESSLTSSTNMMVANFSSTFIANGDYASLRGPFVFADSVCSLTLRYEISKQLNNSKLLLLFIDSSGGGLVLADLAVASNNAGSMTFKFVEVFFSNFSMFPVIYAEKADDEMGSIILHSLEFIPCRCKER